MKGVFYGWWIVLAAAATSVYAAGTWFYGFPIFFKAMLDDFGWSRASTAGVFSLSRLEGGLEGPFVGWLIDRFGPRKLAVLAAIVTGCGFILMSRVRSFSIGGYHVGALMAFGIIYLGVMSLGYNTGLTHARTAAIANWFIRKRSRAMAIYSLGAGLSGPTVVVALGLIVANWGWRTAAVVVGLGMWFIVVPLSLVLRHRPEQYGMLPDGDTPTGEASDALAAARVEDIEAAGLRWGKGAEYDFTVREALANRSFWLLLIGAGCRSIAMTSVVLHQVAYLTDVGISEEAASAALGTLVGMSLLGRVLFGWAGDVVDKRYVLMAAYAFQMAGLLILDQVRSMTLLWIYVFVYSLGYGGAIPVYMAMRGDYFGRRNFATIGGFMQLFLMVPTIMGPIFAGWVFDTTESYHWAFMAFVITLGVGIIFIFLAKRPTPPQKTLAQAT